MRCSIFNACGLLMLFITQIIIVIFWGARCSPVCNIKADDLTSIMSQPPVY